MADDTKVVEKVEEAAEKAEASAEVAVEAATEATEAVEEVKEVVEEVKTDPSTDAQDKKPKKEVSANLEKIIENIEKLSVLELADLVHALEDRFGVTAAPSVISGQAASGAPTGAAEPEAEQTTFNVILASAGANKIGVIKAVRELVQTLGLKEAKDLVEAAPKPVMEGVNKDTANEAKAKLTAAGATVELQ